MTDLAILRWAVDEQRVIVTTDNDFEEMIWRQGRRHCGVLLTRCNPVSSALPALCSPALLHLDVGC